MMTLGDWPFGASTLKCATCHGLGTIEQKVIDYVLAWEPNERLTLDVECTTCGGRGRLVIDPRRAREMFHHNHDDSNHVRE